MSAAQFLALRDAFCELAGEAAPELVADAAGTLAFHQVIGAYSVTFTYAPCLSDNDAFIMMDFGKLDAAAAMQGWQTLLHCNTMMFGKNSPVFGMSQAGNLILQRVHTLATATGQDLYAIVSGLVRWADQWHAGVWLPTDEQALQAPLAAAMLDRLA
jgi:hypothetical protein